MLVGPAMATPQTGWGQPVLQNSAGHSVPAWGSGSETPFVSPSTWGSGLPSSTPSRSVWATAVAPQGLESQKPVWGSGYQQPSTFARSSSDRAEAVPQLVNGEIKYIYHYQDPAILPATMANGQLVPPSHWNMGSVVESTHSYHQVDFHRPTQLSPTSTTDKTLMLDIDNCVVCTKSKMEELVGDDHQPGLTSHPRFADFRGRLYRKILSDVEGAPGSGNNFDYWGIRRPYLDEFLAWAFTYFAHVGIFTAAMDEYAQQMVHEVIFRNSPIKPSLIFSRANMDDAETTKPLINVVNYNDYTRNTLSLSRMVLVDDIPENFAQNPRSGILIPAYKPAATYEGIMAKDRCLEQLQAWFMQPCVRDGKLDELDKSTIFNYTPEEYYNGMPSCERPW